MMSITSRATVQTAIFVVLFLLTFFTGCGGGNSNSPVLNPTPTPTPRLTATPTATPTPTPAPTPRTIAFDSARALNGVDATGNATNIWVVRADGSGATALSKLTTSRTNCIRPAWSPDGSKVAFISDRALDGSDATNLPNFTNNVWVMNADGSGATPLTRLTAFDAGSELPVWSPDGGKIAFWSRRALDGSDAANKNVTNNIWVMNANGTSVVPLTRLTAPGAVFAPDAGVWSPDGSKLAFDSWQALNGSDAANANSTNNIWAVNVDGSGATPLTRITAANADSFDPVWSRDGSKLAFDSSRSLLGSDASNANNTSNIWVVNVDGSGATPLTRITAANADSFGPAWSPDGSKLAFDSSRSLNGSDAPNTNNTSNVWVMNTDGSNAAPLTRITAAKTNSHGPAWSPDGSKLAFRAARALDGSDAANTNGTYNIWVVDADSSNATPLTKLTASGSDSGDATWHP